MEQVAVNFEQILRKLRSVFPKVPILPVIGNNEFVPNYGTWENDTVNFGILSDIWQGLLSPEERRTLEQGGYYYRDFDRLRVIILNTVIYQVYRSPDDRADPYGQFAWLEKICAAAQDSGREVMVFFHVPPSMSTRDRFSYQGWHQKYVDSFSSIFAKYRFAITCGHLHISAILPVFNSVERRNGYLLSAPGLSMRHDSNPGFRLIRFRHGTPIDYDEFGADVGVQPHDSVEWKFQYSFNQLYGTHNLSHGQLTALADRIFTNSTLMWRYRRMMYQRQFYARQFQGCLLRAVSREELAACLEHAPDAHKAIFHGRKHPPPSA
jgi:hypothetical protein